MVLTISNNDNYNSRLVNGLTGVSAVIGSLFLFRKYLYYTNERAIHLRHNNRKVFKEDADHEITINTENGMIVEKGFLAWLLNQTFTTINQSQVLNKYTLASLFSILV